jgi:ribonuclease J
MATSSQNIDRIVSIYRACKKTGRTFVIDAYTALILEAAKSVSYAIPQHDWREHMKVLFVETRHTKIMQKDGILEKFKKSEVKYEDVLKDKGKYLIKDAFAVRNKFAADKNLSRTTLIYSMWDGYLEDDEKLRAFWQDNQVPIIHVHTSGHAHVADLKKFAEALNPRTIIPIHTFEADKFPGLFQNVKLLKDREKLKI